MYTENMVIMPVNQLTDLINNTIKLQLEEFTKKASQPKGDELMNVEETCLLLDCKKTTLHKYKNDGLIKAHRIGRRIFFIKEEVLESLKSPFFKREKNH